MITNNTFQSGKPKGLPDILFQGIKPILLPMKRNISDVNINYHIFIVFFVNLYYNNIANLFGVI